MKRFVAWAGAVLGVLLLGFVAFFFWASSGGLSEEALATIKGYPAEATAPGDTLTVMAYNIGYLSGMTNNEPVVRSDRLFTANMDQAVALLRADDPDIVGFQEIDFGGARVKRVHQLDTLGTCLSPTAAPPFTSAARSRARRCSAGLPFANTPERSSLVPRIPSSGTPSTSTGSPKQP
jgi:hypothetical protein